MTVLAVYLKEATWRNLVARCVLSANVDYTLQNVGSGTYESVTSYYDTVVVISLQAFAHQSTTRDSVKQSGMYK